MFSRINDITVPLTITTDQISQVQQNEEELRELLVTPGALIL